MEEQGLWELFFRTGLPEAYLAIAAVREEEQEWAEEAAKTAFHFRTGQA